MAHTRKYNVTLCLMSITLCNLHNKNKISIIFTKIDSQVFPALRQGLSVTHDSLASHKVI